MKITDNISELALRMGSMASRTEATRMAELLATRNIHTFDELDKMPDNEFFNLIPSCVANR